MVIDSMLNQDHIPRILENPLLLGNFHYLYQLHVCDLRLVCSWSVKISHEYSYKLFTPDVEFNHSSSNVVHGINNQSINQSIVEIKTFLDIAI